MYLKITDDLHGLVYHGSILKALTRFTIKAISGFKHSFAIHKKHLGKQLLPLVMTCIHMIYIQMS